MRKLMHIFHWSLQIKFCEINLSVKKLSSYFTVFRKINETLVTLKRCEKKSNFFTIFTNHNAVWNSKSRVAVQFNLLSYNSLLYPYIIFFLYAAQMFLLAIYTSHLGINLTAGKNLCNRLHSDSSLGLEAFYVMSTSDKFANTWLFVWFTTMAFPKRTWLLWKQL